MKKQQIALPVTALSVTLTLMACGGGSGGTSSLTSNGAATTAQGVITGFGSVFVNGVEYFVGNNTSINMDGTDKPESDLQVGMLVTVQGTVNADGKIGMAKSIHYADLMEGVVTANSVGTNGTGTLTVMGQTVTVTADTIFDSKVAGITSPNLIQIGNIVEVSGYASSTGDVTATRIEVKAASQAAGTVIEVKGIISNLDTTNSTFTLGGLTVDYSGLTSANLPSTPLADGQYVEVKSTTLFDGTGSLVASNIEQEDDEFKHHEGTAGEDLEIKGLVTADFANNQFELNGRTILIDSTTRIENGTVAQLVKGTTVKVHSHFDANGDLVADKIDFKNASKIQLEGTLQAVDTTAGTITILDQVIYVDSNTVLLDKSDSAVRYFNLTDLNPANGDHLEVSAYKDAATGNLIATKLERENFSSDAKINGSVTATARGLVVSGISVDISSAGYVPSLSQGDKVDVTGIYDSGVLHASTVKLDD